MEFSLDGRFLAAAQWPPGQAVAHWLARNRSWSGKNRAPASVHSAPMAGCLPSVMRTARSACSLFLPASPCGGWRPVYRRRGSCLLILEGDNWRSPHQRFPERDLLTACNILASRNLRAVFSWSPSNTPHLSFVRAVFLSTLGALLEFGIAHRLTASCRLQQLCQRNLSLLFQGPNSQVVGSTPRGLLGLASFVNRGGRSRLHDSSVLRRSGNETASEDVGVR